MAQMHELRTELAAQKARLGERVAAEVAKVLAVLQRTSNPKNLEQTLKAGHIAGVP
ncbi:MAG: hypothetical protein PGN34_13135 [Methylobacterium frigidaeris]